MEELEKEFVYLTIKKKKPEDKRYLISNSLRTKLIDDDNYYIGILPYYSITNPINNIKKQYFINISNFVLQNNNEIINLTISKDDMDKVDKLQQDEYIKNKIRYFMNTNLKIDEIKESNFKKILDIENKKIKIYLININKKLNAKKKKSEEEYKLEDLFQNLLIQEKIKLKTIKYLDFYNVWSELKKDYSNNDKKKNTKMFKSRDFKKKLYKNINSLSENNNVLSKTFNFKINMNNQKDDNNIQIRLKHIYNNMFT